MKPKVRVRKLNMTPRELRQVRTVFPTKPLVELRSADRIIGWFFGFAVGDDWGSDIYVLCETLGGPFIVRVNKLGSSMDYWWEGSNLRIMSMSIPQVFIR